MPADSLSGIDKAAVARRFNRSAATYDASNRVQRRMADRLVAGLDRAEMPQRILELGCGTGYLTGLLAQRFPDCDLLAVDFAERMIDIARRRVSGRRIEIRMADAEAAEFEPGRYDLVVSNAAIQWFESPSHSLPRLAASIRPGGRMVHSTLGPGTFAELKWASDPDRTGLPLLAAGEWSAILVASGLHRVVVTGRVEVEHYAGAADFLRELQATGATYRSPRPDTERLPPRALIGAMGRYDARYRSPDGVPVTYELLEVAGALPA